MQRLPIVLLTTITCSLQCGCAAHDLTTYGPGTRDHPRVVESLPGASSLLIGPDTETATVFGSFFRDAETRVPLGDPIILKKGDTFASWGFNCSDTLCLLSVSDKFAVFNWHQSGTSCLQTSPTRHTIETIAVAPYGPEVAPPADPEPK